MEHGPTSTSTQQNRTVKTVTASTHTHHRPLLHASRRRLFNQISSRHGMYLRCLLRIPHRTFQIPIPRKIPLRHICLLSMASPFTPPYSSGVSQRAIYCCSEADTICVSNRNQSIFTISKMAVPDAPAPVRSAPSHCTSVRRPPASPFK